MRWRILIGIVVIGWWQIATAQWSSDWERRFVLPVVPEELRRYIYYPVDTLYHFYIPGRVIRHIAFLGRDSVALCFRDLGGMMGSIVITPDYGRSWDSVLFVSAAAGESKHLLIDMEWDGCCRLYAVREVKRQGKLYYSLLWSEDRGKSWVEVDLRQKLGLEDTEGLVVFDLAVAGSEGAITALLKEKQDTVYRPVVLWTTNGWEDVQVSSRRRLGRSSIQIPKPGEWIVLNHAYDMISWSSDYGAHWDSVSVASLMEPFGYSKDKIRINDIDAVSLDRWYVCGNYYPQGLSSDRETLVRREWVWEIKNMGEQIRLLLDTMVVAIIPEPRLGYKCQGYGCTSNLIEIDFLDTLRGIVTGTSGRVWRTTDGGQTWAIELVDYLPGVEPRINQLFTNWVNSAAYSAEDRIVLGTWEFALFYRPGQLLPRPWVWGVHQVIEDEEEYYLVYAVPMVDSIPFVLRWSPVAEAEQYRVVVYDDENPDDGALDIPERILDTTVVDTNIALWLRPNKELVVIYLRAEGGGKVSNWWELQCKTEDILTAVYQEPLENRGMVVARGAAQLVLWYPKSGQWKVVLYDAQGRAVRSLKVRWRERGEQESIDLRGLPPGVYVLRGVSDQGSWHTLIPIW